ncbi:MAG: carotenoid 1,2-hydratase [bacterium]
MIAFVGSVFSPGYHRARRRDAAADPMDHCAINIHLRGPDGELWVMTERPRGMVERRADRLTLGSTTMTRDGEALVVRFDERTKPFFQRMPRRISGEIRLTPTVTCGAPVEIDHAGRHTWWPIAPHARVEVQLDQPRLRFCGAGYHDANRGVEGLERGFRRWSWSRVATDGGAAVLYDTVDRAGQRRAQGFWFGADGRRDFAPRARVDLGRAGWGVARETRVEDGADARVVETLVAAPFYARSVIETTIDGRPAVGVHEALDCDRFDAGWVRFLLPWRIRREGR